MISLPLQTRTTPKFYPQRSQGEHHASGAGESSRDSQRPTVAGETHRCAYIHTHIHAHAHTHTIFDVPTQDQQVNASDLFRLIHIHTQDQQVNASDLFRLMDVNKVDTHFSACIYVCVCVCVYIFVCPFLRMQDSYIRKDEPTRTLHPCLHLCTQLHI
jgi:hypothetical protein